MKFFASVTTLALVWGCGILSVIFGLPNHHVNREVKASEMVGDWVITPDSEAYVKVFLARYPDSYWGVRDPWKTMTLNADGSCKIQFEPAWLEDASEANESLPCSWQLTEEDSFADSNANATVPALALELRYPDHGVSTYSLFIFEEEGTLILWDVVGDPDDFRLQEFKK